MILRFILSSFKWSLLVQSLLWTAVQMHCYCTPQDIEHKLHDNGLILRDFVLYVAPKELLKVTYKNNVEVCLGNNISPLLTQHVPRVSWNVEYNYYYTLGLIDPDAPVWFLHWLVVNIPWGEVNAGEVLAAYIPPSPPPGTNEHRYTFLLFQQLYKVPNDTIIIRAGFDMQDYADKHRMGDPVAINFFNAESDANKVLESFI